MSFVAALALAEGLLGMVLVFLLVRCVKRLLQHDTVFNAMQETIEAAAESLSEATARPLASDNPDVIAVHKAFLSVRDRMVWLSEQVSSMGLRQLARGDVKEISRPVVA